MFCEFKILQKSQGLLDTKLPTHEAFLNCCLFNYKTIFNIQILTTTEGRSEEVDWINFWESGPNLLQIVSITISGCI